MVLLTVLLDTDKSENEGPTAYEDFLRFQGCPTLLCGDNSKMQTGETLTNICRLFGVSDGLTEPYHPHQNPAEYQAVRWMKQHTQLVMNLTGAPTYVWPDCVSWLVDCHNFSAHEALGYRTTYTTATTSYCLLASYYSGVASSRAT